MDTPRDIARKHRPGRPFEDELEDAIARHVLAKDARIAELEAALDEAVDIWASHLNGMPNVRSRKRLDDVRALRGK